MQSPEYKEIYSAVIDTYMNNAVLRLSSSKSFSCLNNIMLRCKVLQTQTILCTHDHELGMIVLIILATRTFADDAHMLQTAHIINIVNIFDKEFSTAQIYWVLPYQVGRKDIQD